MNNNSEEIAKPPQMEKMDGDRKDDSDLNREQTDVFKIKALELFDKIQADLEEARKSYRREMEVGKKEIEDQIKRHRQMLKDYEELQKKMQQWPHLNWNSRQRRRSAIPDQFQVSPVSISGTIMSSSPQDDYTENIEEADDSDSEDYFEANESYLEENEPDVEEGEPDLEEDLEADLEEDLEADVEEDLEADEPDLQEDLEADEPDLEEDIEDGVEEDLEVDELDVEKDCEENEEAEENNEDEMEYLEISGEVENTEYEYVLEYTPVASETELPSSTGWIDDRKRRASSPLEADNSKKRRLTLVECPVCQESLPELTKSGKLLLVAKCGHVLCSNCAMRIWIQRQKRCPKCNSLYNIEKLLPVYL